MKKTFVFVAVSIALLSVGCSPSFTVPRYGETGSYQGTQQLRNWDVVRDEQIVVNNRRSNIPITAIGHRLKSGSIKIGVYLSPENPDVEVNINLGGSKGFVTDKSLCSAEALLILAGLQNLNDLLEKEINGFNVKVPWKHTVVRYATVSLLTQKGQFVFFFESPAFISDSDAEGEGEIPTEGEVAEGEIPAEGEGEIPTEGEVAEGEGSLPLILQQPQSLEVFVGERASLLVVAENAVNYKWKKDGQAIAGAESAEYVIGSAALRDAGVYHCIVGNPYGSVASNTATLTVRPVVVEEGEGEIPTEGENECQCGTGAPDIIHTVIPDVRNYNPAYPDEITYRLRGTVSGVNASFYGVRTYIQGEDSLWYSKSNSTDERPISCGSCSWYVDIAIHPNDAKALQVVSYLVPLETSVPACITGCVGMPNIPASVAQVVSPLGGASKGIGFSHVPLYGQSNGGVSGYIEGIDPEEYSEFAVLVLQKLNGQWIVAPDCENPLTFIESDLTWHCAISPMAEEVAVYLVDAGFSVDFCVAIPDKGSKDVPEVHGSLASAWVSRVPHISFQSFPPFEQEGNVVIKVTDNDPTLWRVAVYFKVGGEWWTKPLYESPLIQPGIDGLCSVWLDSEGMDFYTMEILVFLVPPNTAVSVCGDCQECQRCSMRPVIPQAVATAWVNRGAGFDTEPPVITLLGDNPLDWPVFVPYVDPEAYAVDVIDGPVPVDIDVSEVNVNVVGQYYVYYSATDSSGNTATATRTVNVVDTEPPVITILGDNPLEWPVGTSYVDPGATATDNYDGNVPVSNVSDVDWSVIGSYTVVYTATDSSGNTATATRTLNVYFDCQAPIIKYTEIPLFGVDDELTGQACRPNDDGAVIVYVRQQDHWWLITDELLDIDSADGSWSCNIDALATEILAFLVPADINPALIPDCDPCTEEPVIGQALASVWVNRSPDFQITYWPPIGATDGYLEGVVWGSVNPSDWKVIVYITVEGRTWIKPDYGIEALTPIGPDGSWSCQIVTGGIDELATHVMAFLVPAGIDLDSVPMCGETFWCGEGPPVIDDAVDLIVIDRTL